MSEAHPTISVLRVYLEECSDNPPRYYIQAEKPANAINRAWIPQTIGDQVWIVYEFKSEQERVQWEAGLSAKLKNWLDRGLIASALTFGWGTRDWNGFLVNET